MLFHYHLTSLHQHEDKPISTYLPSLETTWFKHLKTIISVPHSTSPLLRGSGVWWTLRIMCWRGWEGRGSTTSTCLAGCWCSHRPLASCHLWGRREAADTPRGSCSLAHSATESLTHQGGREGGGRGGDNISIMLCYTFQVSVDKDRSPNTRRGSDKEW